jgi:hypothetical protein
VSSQSVIDNMTRPSSADRPLRISQAATATTTKPVVTKKPVTVWVRRKGKDGLKTMANQSLGKKRASTIS